MESFMKLPWWAQVVFVGTNAFILLILIILINQWVKSQKAKLFVKKKIKPADERGKEYGGEHPSSYIDA